MNPEKRERSNFAEILAESVFEMGGRRMSDVLSPGLLVAAEICDQFAIVNTHIVKDEIDQLCQTDAWTKVQNHEQAHDHAKKAEAASEIGAFLRKMVVEKGGEV